MTDKEQEKRALSVASEEASLLPLRLSLNQYLQQKREAESMRHRFKSRTKVRVRLSPRLFRRTGATKGCFGCLVSTVLLTTHNKTSGDAQISRVGPERAHQQSERQLSSLYMRKSCHFCLAVEDQGQFNFPKPRRGVGKGGFDELLPWRFV